MSNNYCSLKLSRDEFALDADFKIPEKGILGVYGSSGSGKTTLLRCIAGLEQNASGNMIINNRVWLDESISLPAHKRNVGYVFQDGRLFPHKNVRDNIDYGKSRSQRKTIAEQQELLELFHIESLLHRMPYQLSGGEIQRVAIARALLSNPELVLMDEPLASLDETRKTEILPYLDCLHEKFEIPMVYVSHSLDEVSRLCDYVLVMDKGKSIYSGEIHEALVATSSPLARQENAAALLEGRVIAQEPENIISVIETTNGNKFQLQGLFDTGSHIRINIKAGNVSLSKTLHNDTSILNIIQGTVSDIIDEKNSHVLLQLNCNNDLIKARITKKSWKLMELGVGRPVLAQIKSVSIQGY